MFTWNAKNLVLSLNGQQITGIAQDTFMKIEPEGPAFTDVAGADGEVARAQTNEKRARVTITLIQGMAGNALLSSIHEADKSTPGGAPGPFLAQDLLGTTLIKATRAWVEVAPSAEFGSEVKTREWSIRLADAVIFIGNN